MAPKFKVKAHVASFGLYIGIVTAVGLGYAQMFSPTEEEKEAVIREKYPELMKQTAANRKPMQDFFKSMKADIDARHNPTLAGGEGKGPGSGGGQDDAIAANDKKFDSLLRAGKSRVNKNQGANVGREGLSAVEKPQVIQLKGGRRAREKEKEKEKALAAAAKEKEEKKGWW